MKLNEKYYLTLGVLNTWKWPSIKGLKSFRGDLCHTVRWPKELETKGKKVAVIGSGSSGIQLLAHIQPEAEKIYHWIREEVSVYRSPELR